MGSKWRVVRLADTTADLLKEIGRKGESYDDVVMRLLSSTSKEVLVDHAVGK